jgi:hypothetical protein
MRSKNDARSKGTILIADYDFGNVDIERAIVENAGFELVAAQCKSEDEVIEHGRDVDGVLAQYAPIGAHAINAFTRCRVIARYGTGVDIVDVDAATRRGIQVTNAPNDWCAEEVADHAVALWLAAVRKRSVSTTRQPGEANGAGRRGSPSGASAGAFSACYRSAQSHAASLNARGHSASIYGPMTRSSIPRRSKSEMCELFPSISLSKPRTICSSRPRSRPIPATCSIERRCGG